MTHLSTDLLEATTERLADALPGRWSAPDEPGDRLIWAWTGGPAALKLEAIRQESGGWGLRLTSTTSAADADEQMNANGGNELPGAAAKLAHNARPHLIDTLRTLERSTSRAADDLEAVPAPDGRRHLVDWTNAMFRSELDQETKARLFDVYPLLPDQMPDDGRGMVLQALDALDDERISEVDPDTAAELAQAARELTDGVAETVSRLSLRASDG